jgi:hypothetical protein
MLIEAESTPAQEVESTTPAPELTSETVETAPEVTTDEATDATDESQSTATDDSTAEGTTDDDGKPKDWRDAVFTRKTQELAEVRKGLEQRQQRLDSVVQQGEALVQALTDEFQAEFKDVNWGELAANDPAEYVRKQHALSQRQGKLQAALYRLNEAKTLQSTTSQQATQERLREEQAALVSKLPEWKDAGKYAQESAEISKFLSDSGYSPEEVAGVTDHRAVLLARDAMLWRKQQAKLPKPTTVTKAPQPVPKAPTRAPGQKSIDQMNDREFAEYRKRQIAQRRP